VTNGIFSHFTFLNAIINISPGNKV